VLIVDTGPLVATADRADKDHTVCRQLLESDEGPMVIAEAAYLIDRQLGAKAEASLYASIIDGQLEVADLGIADWQRIQDLVSSYADLRLGGTDASVVALAERHGAVRIATLNRRHFAVVRPRHAEAFELLP
jgi:uncharacterized protein